MKKVLFMPLLVVFWAGLAEAQFMVPKATDWEGVVAKVIVCRQSAHFLYAEVELIHTQSVSQPAQIQINMKETLLTDAATGKSHAVLHDEAGHYLAGPFSGQSGSDVTEILYPGEKLIVYAFFTTMLTPSSPVDLSLPGIRPFYRVPIRIQDVNDTGDHVSPYADIRIEKIRGHRLRHVAQFRVQMFSSQNRPDDGRWINYNNVLLYDYENQRIYPLLRNKRKNNQFIAEPHADAQWGGRFAFESLTERGQWFYLKFEPPPDWVKQVLFLSPFSRPARLVPLSGKSLKQQQGGHSVLGAPTLFTQAMDVLSPVEGMDDWRFSLPVDDLFAPDHFEIVPEIPALRYLNALIHGLPVKRVDVTVHSDNQGNPAFLMVISGKQAESLGKWLREILKGYCTVAWEGVGPQYPIAKNDSEEGQKENRRVEIRLVK